MDAKAKQVLILYGSQTGNAEWIARHIFSESQERGYTSVIMTLDESIAFNWTNEYVLIIVTSSTGDGDPPDNAIKFWKWLRKNGAVFTHRKYAILGLGDTNYSNFCNTAKRLDRRFVESGILDS